MPNLTNRKNSYMVSLCSRWRKGFIRPGTSPRPVAPSSFCARFVMRLCPFRSLDLYVQMPYNAIRSSDR
nr:MAG TPA: hypothetical protein [Caudoviricetes sp.]